MTNEFLNDLFGDQDGIVYSPIKGDVWEQYFFEWPQQRDALERHINDYDNRDVYLSPVLFTEKRISPETFKSTRYLWTEFDGNVPSLENVIEPSMRVLSSQDGHEHWYWRLDEALTDKVHVEDLTRRIAYQYDADLSVWDYQNVLRPPDTWNYKRNKPVVLKDKNELSYPTDLFTHIPIPPANTKVAIKLGSLPGLPEVLAKYKWKTDTQDLLFKDIATGSRSAALFRLAFDAIEAGCSNEEAYVVTEDRDRAWGKYLGRTDRDKQLTACIAKARGRRALTSEIVQDSSFVYRFNDFMKTDIKLKWAIEGLLPVAGSMVILGQEGVGKSTFALRMAMALSRGDSEFLGWNLVTRQRTLFISLEMQHAELKEFFLDMQIPEEDRNNLQEWFHIWPIGHAYPFDTPDQQIELIKFIDLHKIELVIVDSLSLSMYGSINDNEDIKRLNAFFNEDLRKDRGCGYAFIHHPRKRGTGEDKKPSELDDSYGSRFITANAQTVLALSQKSGSTKVSVNFLKTRMSQGRKQIDIVRTDNRGFQLVSSTTPVSGTEASKQSGDAPVSKGLLGLFNSGS
jgi:AAA domain